MLLASICHFLIANPSSSFSEQSPIFKHSTILDHENKVRLEWTSVIKSNRGDSIRFKLTLFEPEQFYRNQSLIFGFGMSDRGKLTSTDICVFEIGPDGKMESFQDAWLNSEGYMQPYIRDEPLCMCLFKAFDGSINCEKLQFKNE